MAELAAWDPGAQALGPAVHVPAAAPAGVRFRRGGRTGRLPRRPGRDARLPVADPAGQPGIPARLRRGGPLARLGRPRRRGRLPRDGRAVPPPSPRGRGRHRAQPHGPAHARVTQQAAVVGAVPGPGLAVRALVRRRLGGAGRQAAHAHPGRAAGEVPGRPHHRHRAEDPGERRAPRPGAALLRPRAAAAGRRRRPAAGHAARRAALPAGRLARRGHPAQLAPVLRHRHAHRDPGRGPRRVRGHPPGAAAPGRRGPDRRPAGGPPGRAGRPGRLPAAAGRRDRRHVGRGGEDPGPRRGAAGLGLRGHHRLRRARPGRRAVRGPGRRAPADRGLRPVHRREAGLRRGGPGRQARHRRRHVHRRAVPADPAVRPGRLPGPGRARRGRPARRAGRAAGRVRRVPGLRAARRAAARVLGGRRVGRRGRGPRGPGAQAAPGAGRGVRGGARPGRRGGRRGAAGRPRRAGRAVRPDHGAGAGQGGRGHRLLPLAAAGQPERGGRRPGHLRRQPGRVPRRRRRASRRGGRPP